MLPATEYVGCPGIVMGNRKILRRGRGRRVAVPSVTRRSRLDERTKHLPRLPLYLSHAGSDGLRC